jgi:hypothetical protein
MQIQALPRESVHLALGAARLPLTAIERLAGHSGDAEWPPALAFDAVGANVKQIFGSILRDEVLVDEGRLQNAKVAELREAARLEAVAKQRERAADAELHDRRETAGEKRAAAERQATERKAQAAQRARKEATDAAEKLRREEAKAREIDDARQKEIAKKERSARATSIAKEREALRSEKTATKAKAEVIELDQELRESKAMRKSS